jgi:uncharacterized protein (TIGR02145 family)
MKKNKLFLLFALLFYVCANLPAQVTIGGLTEPTTGTVLDLNSTNKGGLLLSNVTITNLELIPYNANVFPGITSQTADTNPALRGTMVYNNGRETTVPAGIYVWNGYSWTLCGNSNFTVTPSSPSVVSILAGNTTALNITSSTYQWYKGQDVNSGTLIPNATAATYTTPDNLKEGTTHYYYCKINSPSGPATSDVFTVKVISKPDKLSAGSGTFIGPTCLDLAQDNDGGNNCAPLSARQSKQTNFSNRYQQDGATGPYSGVQVYTFTPIGTVSHVRFAYEETADISVEHIEPLSPTYDTANNINTACKVIVYYKEKLNSDLKGKTRTTGNKLKLYAIYNSDAVYSKSANDKKLELNISLQDCNCCGAYTDANKTNWLNFMCHNLGANENADPFTPEAAIHGGKYKWGVAGAAMTQEEDQDKANNISVTNWLKKGNVPPTNTNTWSMTADPCPVGWRLPVPDEWNKVLANNALIYPGSSAESATNFTSGLKIGDALFLPATGYRAFDTGMLKERGLRGFYWSNYTHDADLYYIGFSPGAKNTGHGYIGDLQSRHQAQSVRCVAK